jgi:hypothetical protein
LTLMETIDKVDHSLFNTRTRHVYLTITQLADVELKRKHILHTFNISSITDHQEQEITATIGGNDVCVGTLTGSGNYECMSVCCWPKTTVLAIAPLLSIIKSILVKAQSGDISVIGTLKVP